MLAKLLHEAYSPARRQVLEAKLAAESEIYIADK